MKILIVEDEEMIIKVTKKTFSSYGECEGVQNLEDAMEMYKSAVEEKKPYGLILLDISLGSENGLTFLREIRKIEKDSGVEEKESTKIVMITGNNKESIVKEAISSGCNGYILKPVVPDMVLKTMKKLKIKPLEEEAG